MIAPFLIAAFFHWTHAPSLIVAAVLVIAAKMLAPSLGTGFIAAHLAPLILGIVSYLVWRKLAQTKSMQINQLRAAALAAIAISSLFINIIPATVWIITLYAVIAKDYQGANIERRFCSCLRLSPLRFFGRISYSIYLVHVLVMVACFAVLNGFTYTSPREATILMGLLLIGTVVTAALLYSFVERPFIALGKSIISRSAPAMGDHHIAVKN